MKLFQLDYFLFSILAFISLFQQSSSFSSLTPLMGRNVITAPHQIAKQTYLQIKSTGIVEEVKALSQTEDDISKIVLHLASCVLFASVLTLWEGIDCTYLKPLSATIRNYPETSVVNSTNNNEIPGIIQLMSQSTRGMGRGAIDRSDGWYQDTYATSLDSGQEYARIIPSYNEIMLEHRAVRVPAWKKEVSTKDDVIHSVDTVIRALETINELKSIAPEYEWETMKEILQGPLLTLDLQYSCSVLQQARDFLSSDVRQEIGFDWGSCAWRRCGAQADAQESLAELYNSIGLFEPFECLFTIDIVERSLRDILTVIPEDYKPNSNEIIERIGSYTAYEPRNAEGENEDGVENIDKDFLDALVKLRSVNFDVED